MPLPVWPGSGSILVFYTPLSLPFYSARGLTQTISPIKEKEQMERNINGWLVDLSLAQFEKYQSKITCTDMNAPTFDKVWQGNTCYIDCCTELPFATGGTPGRPLATGSSVRSDGNGTSYYYPKLYVMIRNIQLEFPEYTYAKKWEVDVEEV